MYEPFKSSLGLGPVSLSYSVRIRPFPVGHAKTQRVWISLIQSNRSIWYWMTLFRSPSNGQCKMANFIVWHRNKNNINSNQAIKCLYKKPNMHFRTVALSPDCNATVQRSRDLARFLFSLDKTVQRMNAQRYCINHHLIFIEPSFVVLVEYEFTDWVLSQMTINLLVPNLLLLLLLWDACITTWN